ncbi:MAG: chemotaxis protein [Leptospirales bacterium]|nr:chemotaxis protein [Leptospirales bacterium]
MIEKNLQDILNAGIGLFKAGESNFKTAVANLEKSFTELKNKGAADNSDAAIKIREILENTLRSAKDVQSKAETNLNAFLAEAQKNYAQVIEQAKKVVGEERIRDLNTKIDELNVLVKQKLGQGTPGAPK